MKRWLRNWLGVTDYVDKNLHYVDLRITALEGLRADVLRRIADIQNIKPHDPNKHEERICNLELRSDPSQELVLGRLAGLDIVTQAHAEEFASIHKLHNDLQAALQEIRQIRETVLDPKKLPIATRNSRQFRALVEQDAG